MRGPAERRPARRRAAAAGAGRIVGGGQGVRRPVRRGRLHRAADPRRGAGVLRRPQGPARRVRPARRRGPGGPARASSRSSGPTEAEARALEQEFTDLISPDYALRQLSEMLGIDLTDHPLDAPLPPIPPGRPIEGNKSRYQLVRDLAEGENLTVRAAASRGSAAGAGTGRSRARPSRSPTRSRPGSSRVPRTASTSCRRTCPAGSTTSSTTSCRSCRTAGCSGASTRGRRCARTTAWRPHVNRYAVEPTEAAVRTAG